MNLHSLKCSKCKNFITIENKNVMVCNTCIDKYDIRLGLEPKFKPTERINVYSSYKQPVRFEMQTNMILYNNHPKKGKIKSVDDREKYAIVKLDDYPKDTFIVPFEQMKKLTKKKKLSTKYLWVKFFSGSKMVEYGTAMYNSKLHKDWVKYKKVK